MNDMVKINRNEGLGGTDAKRIVEGDWASLYLEKVGLRIPESLDHIFRVQLGVHTEPFHMQWLANREGWRVSPQTNRIYHAEHRFMFAHLDGWVDEIDLPLEVKHTNGRESVRTRAQFYMPQLQHYMAVANAPAILFSIIAGNDEPDFVKVDRSDEYIEQLIERETAFWWHVEHHEQPEAPPAASTEEMKTLATIVPIDGLRDYDMGTSNAWAASADDYLKFKDAAVLFETAKANLKQLVPADAATCTGAGVIIKRSKNGSLRFS
jgi:predicted phage-related endonuclease